MRNASAVLILSLILSACQIQPVDIASKRDPKILLYRNVPLSVVVEKANRLSTRKIFITDPAIADRMFSGAIYPSDLWSIICEAPHEPWRCVEVPEAVGQPAVTLVVLGNQAPSN